MDRKFERTRAPKPKQNLKQLSAFEMSINPEFQVDTHQKEATALKPKDRCPQCRSAKIDYDQTLNLSCPNCSFTLAGCFT